MVCVQQMSPNFPNKGPVYCLSGFRIGARKFPNVIGVYNAPPLVLVGEMVPHCWSVGEMVPHFWIVGEMVPHFWSVGEMVPCCWSAGEMVFHCKK